MTERPVFIEKNRLYVSAGVLLYTKDPQGTCSFMLQKIKDRGPWTYEDFGGKSDVCDKSIKDTALRECLEELNCLEDSYTGPITWQFLETQLADRRSIVYRVPDNKYILYIIYVPYELKSSMNMKDFGTYEILDGIQRTVTWLSYRDFMELDSKDLHPRFKPTELRDNLALLIARTVCRKR